MPSGLVKKTAVASTVAVVLDNPAGTTLSSFLHFHFSADISFTGDQITQIKVGSTNIKILIPLHLSVLLSVIKNGNNSITLKINAPRHLQNNSLSVSTTDTLTTTAQQGNEFLIQKNVMEHHDLETTLNYEDVMTFQEAHHTTYFGLPS